MTASVSCELRYQGSFFSASWRSRQAVERNLYRSASVAAKCLNDDHGARQLHDILKRHTEEDVDSCCVIEQDEARARYLSAASLDERLDPAARSDWSLEKGARRRQLRWTLYSGQGGSDLTTCSQNR